MRGRPEPNEAVEHYWKYINRVQGDDPIAALERQLKEAVPFLQGIPEEKSTYRYAPGKWSMREALSHVTDTERSFAYRALWFGRGFTTPLEGLPEDEAAAAAQADRIPWAAHVEEFRQVRLATISLFQHMPEEGWNRSGIVSGNPITVRALSFLTTGHPDHHLAIFRERYLAV
ncbi:MAG TPA: DinB family protein [Acidobacteriaceae bacterium]|nr:DinB family protein [Acidobacteriaceae bacterium]